MRYYVGHLVVGENEKFYQKVRKDVCERFNLEDLSKKKRIPHVTLKSPFETDDKESVERILDTFCYGQESFNLVCKGIECFYDEVIYFNLEGNEESGNLLRRMYSCLDILPGMTWSEYDRGDRQLHIIIAKCDELEGKFYSVWDYLLGEGFLGTLCFDNFALFREDGERTLIERVFKFRK